MMETSENKFTYIALFCGSGLMSMGVDAAGGECLGAFDSDPLACEDHFYLTGRVAHPVNLGTMMPEDLRALVGDTRPDSVFTSPPCKGFSGNLPAAKSRTQKYQSMNELAFRGIWLCLEAWKDAPPPFIVMENVPKIQTRGRKWLDDLASMLSEHGYVSRETTHDCGRIGGLAQSRDRFLLVARHVPQVGQFVHLHEPPKHELRGVGEVIGDLPVPVPGCGGGPMHRLPRLSALNWLRLALIPPGKDWKALPESVALAPRSARFNGGFGVNVWNGPARAVVAEGSVRNTWASIQDPRIGCSPRNGAYGVQGWSETAGTVIAHACHDNGAFVVADPRVTTPKGRRHGSLGVKSWEEPATTVIAHGSIANGNWTVADPRLKHPPRRGGHGVQGWSAPAKTVIAHPTTCKGHNIADPRWPEPTHELVDVDGQIVLVGPELDLESIRPASPVPIIRALDGTWHRPLTTLELAVLQGLPYWHAGDWLCLAGKSHKTWREHIGNGVPVPAAWAIAREISNTLEEVRRGTTFRLGNTQVWVERRAV